MPSEYISGGYYLTPRPVRSASGCIAAFFPDAWCIEWSSATRDQRIKSAARFGISEAGLPRVIDWATAAFSEAFGWPNAFHTLEAARQARATMLAHNPDVLVLGLGLHGSLAENFLIAARPPAQTPGYAPVGETGIFQCVKTGASIAAGGDHLGFELLATDFGLLNCSWLCNGLEKECAARLGVLTNSSGLVETYPDALRCADYISRDDVGAEPGLWLPWLLTVYPASDPR